MSLSAPSPASFAPSRWVARYEPGVEPRLTASDALVSDLVASAAASAPTFPALVCFGSRVSYASLHALAERVASALVRDGLRHGQRVVIALPDCAESVAATLGVARAGGVVSFAAHTDPEPIAAAAAGSAFVLVEPDIAGALAGAVEPAARLVMVDPAHNLPHTVRLLTRLARRRRSSAARRRPRGAVAWPTWLRGQAAEIPPPAPDAPVLEVDGVTFAHRHLVAAAAQLRAWLTDAVPGGETWLVLAPPSSALGIVAVLGSAAALRARTVLLPAWQPEDVVDALRTYQPTWVVADRAAVTRLAADPLFGWADLRSVRAWLVGGPLPDDVARGFEEAAGTQPCVGLSDARAAGLLTCQPVNGRRVLGTVGLPLPGVAVAELPDGRLALRAPTIVEAGGDGVVVVAGTLDGDGYVRVAPESA